MENIVRKLLIVGLVSSLFIYGCAWFERQSHETKMGAGIGAAVGGISGLIIDSHNPWRGGVIGTAVGAVAGGVIGNIIDHSTHEAAHRNAPVRYSRTTESGATEEVVAAPQKTEGNYRLVTVKYVRDGKVVGEETKRVPVD